MVLQSEGLVLDHRRELPPGVGLVYGEADFVGAEVFWEHEHGDVAIAPDDVPASLTFVVVPDTFGAGSGADDAIAGVARAHPGPIALDEFIGGALGDLAGFDGGALGGGAPGFAISGRMFDTEPIDGPHGQVAVAPTGVARGFGFSRPVGIPVIRRAVEGFGGGYVGVERSVGFALAIMDDGFGADVGPDESAGGTPIAVERVEILVIVGVHVIAEILLFLVRDTLDPLGLDLGAGQGWEQHACENGDDGDDDEQLDECEGARVRRAVRWARTWRVHGSLEVDKTES